MMLYCWLSLLLHTALLNAGLIVDYSPSRSVTSAVAAYPIKLGPSSNVPELMHKTVMCNAG